MTTPTCTANPAETSKDAAYTRPVVEETPINAAVGLMATHNPAANVQIPTRDRSRD